MLVFAGSETLLGQSHMGRTVLAGATALAAFLAVGGMATDVYAKARPRSKPVAALRCAKANEVSAIQASAIQQQLMVAALTCNAIENFNAFQNGYNAELRASDATLMKMFKRLYPGRQGEAEYHAFKTRMANDSSVRSIHDNQAYCASAREVFAAALVPARPTLSNFVASIPVKDESPVQSCEITVAAGFAGAPAAATTAGVAVPTPNPLRVAMLIPSDTTVVAAPAAQAAAPEAVAPAATDVAHTEQPQPAKPEEKKDGWLSGIFN